MAWTKEQKKEYDRQYRIKNRDKILAYQRQYRSGNNEHIKLFNRKYEAAKKLNP